MESINKDQLQELSGFHRLNCVSIYIPTHRYGKEVNEGQDAIVLKNHYQKIKSHLQEKNIPENEAKRYLMPVRELIDDKNFWHQQQKGLAVFLAEGYFQYFQLPYEVEEFSLLGTSFHLDQLIPIFERDNQFYILGLSLKKVRLFLANEYDIEELNVADLVPEDIDTDLSYYDFNNASNAQSPSQWEGGNASPSYHGKERDKGYNEAYLEEHFRHVNESLELVIKEKDLPVVLAAVEYLHPVYRKINKSLNLIEKGIKGNPDEVKQSELHQKALELVRPYLEKEKFRQMDQYRALAGTRRASFDIHEIAPAVWKGG